MKSTLISENCPELVLIKQSRGAMSVEQRLEINPKVREMLEVADNGIIIYAAIIFHHDLAFRELKRRIENYYFNDLGELFDLMDQMYPAYHGKAHNKVFSLTWERILTISKSKPITEIVDLVKEYGGGIHLLGDDLAIIDEMLDEREDLNEIAETLLSLGFKPEELSRTLRDRPRN